MDRENASLDQRQFGAAFWQAVGTTDKRVSAGEEDPG